MVLYFLPVVVVRQGDVKCRLSIGAAHGKKIEQSAVPVAPGAEDSGTNDLAEAFVV